MSNQDQLISQLKEKISELEQKEVKLKKTEEKLQSTIQQLGATNQQVLTSEKKYRTMVESISDGFFILETDKLIVSFFNKAAEKLLGRKKKEIMGKPLFEAFPEAKGSEFESKYREAFTKKKQVSFEIYFGTNPYTNWYDVSVYPGEDSISVFFQVITERKQLEQEVTKARDFLKETEKIGKIGGWQFDPVTLKQTWSDEIFRILEIDLAHGAPDVPKGLDFIDPDFRPKAERAIQQAIQKGEPYNQQWLVTTAKGNKKWVNAVCNPKIKKGKVDIISGSFQDITSQKIVTEKLKESEENIKTVLNNSPFPVAMVDEEDQHILFWSKSALKLFGHNPKTSQEWHELAYPDPVYREAVLERWKPFLKTARKAEKAINTGEYEICCKNGEIKICEIYAQFIPDNLIVTLNDITESKKATEQLKALNQQLQANEQEIKASNQQLSASEQQLLSANQQLKASEQQLLAANQQLVANEQQLKAALQQLQANEQQLKAANQELIKAKEKAEKSEEKFSTIFNMSSSMICVADINTATFKFINPSFKKVLGYEEKELLSKPFLDFIHPDDVKPTTDVIEQKLKAGIPKINFENRYRRKDGKYRYLAWNSYPFPEKGITYAIAHDITEQKRIELELIKAKDTIEESEKKFRNLFNSMQEGVYLHQLVYDDQGKACNYRIIEANPISEEYLNIKTEDAIGKLATDLYGTAEAPFLDIYSKVAETGKPASFEQHFEPMKKHFMISVFSPKKGEFATAFLDITEQKRKEKEILEAKREVEKSEEKLRFLFDNMIQGVVYQNANGEIIYANNASEKILGLSLDQMQGRKSIDPSWKAVHEDGSEYPGETHPSMISLRTGQKQKNKIMGVYNPSRNDYTWININSIPKFKDGEKTPSQVVTTFEDITKIKKTTNELSKAKEKAEESDRLKSAFLANMSHEIRTPMNGILGFTELLKEPQLTGPERKKYINIIQSSGDRLLNTVNDLIDFSKIEAGQMKLSVSAFDIKQLNEELLTFFYKEAKKKDLQLILHRSSLTNAMLVSDKGKIYSILSNLIKNAIKYTSDGSIDFGFQKMGKELQFFVKDTGKGIPKEKSEAIFDRFIRNEQNEKEVSEGSGLGLAISKAYVEMLGGKIWVESTVGQGSQFYFTIPYKTATSKITESEKAETTASGQIKKLKILIAEDDEAAIELLSVILKKIGATILHTKSGTETIELCQKHPDIDVILMDINMPEMNGYEATRKIRKFNKDVFIIAQTAFALAGDREKSLAVGCNDYISKPINKNELLKKIENGLKYK